MQRRRGSVARASASAFATADIVEYHPSMSLDGAAAPPPPVSPHPNSVSIRSYAATQPTLASVLVTRAALWDRVNTLVDTLSDDAAYARECAAVRELQQLHFLCNILFDPFFFR